MKNRARSVTTWTAAATALIWLGCSVYTPGYVTRVLVRQDANLNDYLWKRSATFPRAENAAPLIRSLDAPRIEAAYADAGFDGSLDQFLGQSDTHTFLVLQGEHLIFERYAEGHDRATPQPTFSVSKSVLSILLHAAISEGILPGLDQAVTASIPALAERDALFDRIQWRHLLNMRSGIAFSQDTKFPFVNGDAPQVYYARDLRRVALRRTQIESEPGPFHYNDYNPNLLALSVERFAGSHPASWLSKHLWQRVGATDPALWSTDYRGFPHFDSGLVVSARDLAKIGLMLLKEGSAPGGRVLSAEQHRQMTSFPEQEVMAARIGPDWLYANGWWGFARTGSAPDYAAIGRFGQFLYVSPEHRVLFVRTGGEGSPSDPVWVNIFHGLAKALGDLSQ